MKQSHSGNGLSILQLERILQLRRSKLQHLEGQRAKLARKLESIEGKIVRLGGRAGIAGPGLRAHNAVSLNDAIAAVLKKANASVKIADIVKRVQAAGYRSTSPNFRGIVAQSLIKDERFAKGAERGTYRLK